MTEYLTLIFLDSHPDSTICRTMQFVKIFLSFPFSTFFTVIHEFSDFMGFLLLARVFLNEVLLASLLFLLRAHLLLIMMLDFFWIAIARELVVVFSAPLLAFNSIVHKL